MNKDELQYHTDFETLVEYIKILQPDSIEDKQKITRCALRIAGYNARLSSTNICLESKISDLQDEINDLKFKCTELQTELKAINYFDSK